MKNGIAASRHILIPAPNPFFTRSILPPPRFWAVKLDTPFPIVVKQVIVKVLSLIAAEYPAMTEEPKELTRLWIKIFPTEIKLCCRILGTAIRLIRFSISPENNSYFSAV